MRVWVAGLFLVVALAGCTDDAEPDQPGLGGMGDNQGMDGHGEQGGAGAPADGTPAALSTGFLRGVVVDEAVRPLENAQVSIRLDGQEQANLTTDADGNFGVGDLPPGSYKVRVSKDGFETRIETADVVAGEQVPEPIQILLAAVVEDTSQILPLHLTGTLGCAFGVDPYSASPCDVINRFSGVNIVTDNSAVLFYDEIMAVGQQATYVVNEMVWEANNAYAESMAIQSHIGSWELWNDNFQTAEFFGGSDVGSGYVREVLTDEPGDGESEGALTRHAVGIDTGIGIQIYPRFGGEPVSVVINQPFEMFTHVFYGCEPIEGWSFVAGDPVECTPV